MDKYWHESKTVWGAILLAIEAGILAYPSGILQMILAALGVFITIFGFRAAME